MSKTELLKIFALLEANYELQFAKKTDLNKKAMVNLWAEHFGDKDYNIVYAAVNSYIASDTTGYIPNVGQINEHIRKLTQQDEMTEVEAINLIDKALSNSGYHADEEFKKLPPILQRLVGSPNKLREWASMPDAEINTVVYSNLMRSYKVLAKRETERQALPSKLINMLEETANKMCIEGSVEDGR